MVKITNGIETFIVPKGSVEIYKNQGFKVLKDKPTAANKTGKTENDVFVDKMIEKPMGEWKSADVKKFAEIMGVDLKGTESLSEAKQRIKNFIDTEM